MGRNALKLGSPSCLSIKDQLLPTAKKLILGMAEATRLVSEKNQDRPGRSLNRSTYVRQRLVLVEHSPKGAPGALEAKYDMSNAESKDRGDPQRGSADHSTGKATGLSSNG